MVAALLAGCGKAKKEEAAEAEAPTPVLVETAVLGAIDHVVAADAVLFSINQSSVTPKISAPVKRVLVNRGDHVRAGQLIAELESSDLAAAVEEAKFQYEQAQSAYATVTGATVVEDQTKAQADVQSAQSAFDAAKKLYDSRVALQKEGALAQRQVDETRLQMVQAQTQLETAQQHLKSLNGVGRQEAIRAAQAQMNAAKAHVDTLAVQLSYARILSPISGVVADRPVYAGEMASAGMPLISIVDISQVRAVANVPVREAESIKVGRHLSGGRLARLGRTGPQGIRSRFLSIRNYKEDVWMRAQFVRQSLDGAPLVAKPVDVVGQPAAEAPLQRAHEDIA